MIFVNFSEIRIKDADWNVGGWFKMNLVILLLRYSISTDRAIFVERKC
jgi:hypothetical protein